MSTVPVKGLDDKIIVQIACGQQHSIALDKEGYAHGFIEKRRLIISRTQYCIRMGLQWLLPSRPRESEGRFSSSNCSPGRSFVGQATEALIYKYLAVRRATQAVSRCKGGSRSFKLCSNRPAGHVLCGRKGQVWHLVLCLICHRRCFLFFSGRIRAMVSVI